MARVISKQFFNMTMSSDFFQTLLAGPYAPWLTGCVLLILLGTAAWDARTGIVPNIPLLVGAIAITLGWLLQEGWEKAAMQAGMGIGAWAVIWLVNEGWYKFFKKDALGMGDAKWTALAIIAFGPLPAVFAWLAGSWVSIAWILLCYCVGKRIRKVYFAPFLFCGLMIGLAVTRGLVKLPYPFTF